MPSALYLKYIIEKNDFRNDLRHLVDSKNGSPSRQMVNMFSSLVIFPPGTSPWTDRLDGFPITRTWSEVKMSKTININIKMPSY